MKTPDIHKAAGIIVEDRQLLVSRSEGKDVFVAPGGKLEFDAEKNRMETPEEAVIRELLEEQGVEVRLEDLVFFGTFNAVAAGHEDQELQLRMDVYEVTSYTGELHPHGEIEENRWVTSTTASDEGIKLGSIFEHEVIPRLVAGNRID